MRNSQISILDRLIAVFTYFSFGMVGLIWILICFFRKKELKPFTSYHIYQSIFLGVVLYVISILCDIAFGLMSNLPFVGGFIKSVVVFFAGNPIYFGYSIVHLCVFVIICWLSLGALMGKYSYFPIISDVIKSNFRR